MFEDKDKNGASKPEDIFDQVDESAQPVPSPRSNGVSGETRVPPNLPGAEMPKPQPQPAVMPPKPTLPPFETPIKPRGKMKIVLFIIGVVVLLAALGVLGYFAYAKFFADKSDVPAADQVPSKTSDESDSAENTDEQTPEVNSDEVPNGDPGLTDGQQPVRMDPKTTDSDSDGLTDLEEQQYKTDPKNPDTDEDGLFDHEEVSFYQTDPTNPDTDGDSYKDGEEVFHNYNPKGEGKLFDVPKP